MDDYTPQGPARYGQYYWCIKTKVSQDGEIYVNADEARILPDGTLAMIRTSRTDGHGNGGINLALAPGHWTAVFAASCMDGSAVAVDHWKGEVAR